MIDVSKLIGFVAITLGLEIVFGPVVAGVWLVVVGFAQFL